LNFSTLFFTIMLMRLFFFMLVMIAAFMTFKPSPVLCVYCAGGTPCYSNVDCSAGCRCQAPPYYQGVCIQDY